MLCQCWAEDPADRPPAREVAVMSRNLEPELEPRMPAGIATYEEDEFDLLLRDDEAENSSSVVSLVALDDL